MSLITRCSIKVSKNWINWIEKLLWEKLSLSMKLYKDKEKVFLTLENSKIAQWYLHLVNRCLQFKCLEANKIKQLTRWEIHRWALLHRPDKVCSLQVVLQQEECHPVDLDLVNMGLTVPGDVQESIKSLEHPKLVKTTTIILRKQSEWCL